MKTGDYVRTEDGIITKIKMFYNQKFEEPECVYARFLCEDMKMYEYPRKVKVSPNIIDLIEEGDYVNGYLIAKIYDVFETSPNKLKEAHIKFADENFVSQLYDTEIKSIVTKEQFESMEYRIES